MNHVDIKFIISRVFRLNEKYIGIVQEGIKELSIDDWFKYYGVIVETKLKNIKKELQYQNAHNLIDSNIFKQAAYGILSIKLLQSFGKLQN